MIDISPTFNNLLQTHNAQPASGVFNLDGIEGFLKEAYRINAIIRDLHHELKDVRQAYLSTAQPRRTHIRPGQAQQRYLTDRDREEIDLHAKQSIRELNARIRALEDAEQLRRETDAAVIRKKYVGALGALGAWAAGGRKNVTKSPEHAAAEDNARDTGIHRDAVLWYLRRRLELCCATQQEMMEVRLTREMEKNKSVLAKSTLPPLPGQSSTQSISGLKTKSTASALPPGDEASPDWSNGLTDEQIQMFEKGNQDMMQHYETTLDKVRVAEQSLVEISELQSLLVNNLATQSANIDLLVADSFVAAENVGGGNKELKKATQRPSTARYTFFAASGLCAFLIVWDLLI